MRDLFLESLINQSARQEKGSSFGEAIRRGGPDRERRLAAKGFQIRPTWAGDDFEGSYDDDDGQVATGGPVDSTRDMRDQLRSMKPAQQPGFHPKTELVNGREARVSLDKRVREIDYRIAQINHDIQKFEGEMFRLREELTQLKERKQKIVQGLRYADSFK
jgi:hypothetical protein